MVLASWARKVALCFLSPVAGAPQNPQEVTISCLNEVRDYNEMIVTKRSRQFDLQTRRSPGSTLTSMKTFKPDTIWVL
jgi:hypothetical protein